MDAVDVNTLRHVLKLAIKEDIFDPNALQRLDAALASEEAAIAAAAVNRQSRPVTKKIAIAVAATSTGAWNAISWGGPEVTDTPKEREKWKDSAFEGLDDAGLEGFVWVEVEIPLPEEATVPGVAGALETSPDHAALCSCGHNFSAHGRDFKGRFYCETCDDVCPEPSDG